MTLKLIQLASAGIVVTGGATQQLLKDKDVKNSARDVFQESVATYHRLSGIAEPILPENLIQKINTKNAEKPTDARTVLFMQGTPRNEKQDAILTKSSHHFLYSFTKDYRIVSTALPTSKLLQSQIQKAKKSYKTVNMMVIVAHGSPDAIRCGKFGWWTNLVGSDLKKEDFDGLDENATIALISCKAGRKLASQIAKTSGRTVIASPKSIAAEDMAYINGEVVAWKVKWLEDGSISYVSILRKYFPDGTSEPVEMSPSIQEYLIARELYYCQSEAEEGNTESQYRLGRMYEYGQNGLEQSDEKALQWYSRAAEDPELRSLANEGIRRIEILSACFGTAS